MQGHEVIEDRKNKGDRHQDGRFGVGVIQFLFPIQEDRGNPPSEGHSDRIAEGIQLRLRELQSHNGSDHMAPAAIIINNGRYRDRYYVMEGDGFPEIGIK